MALKKITQPKTVRNVRSFLGLSGYYRQYICNYAKLSEPLTKLTQKHVKFKWTEECENSFQQIIKELEKLPILSHPRIDLPYTLYTDASDFAIGAVLAQSVSGKPCDEKPLFFLSHKLSKSQRKYSTILKEALSLMKWIETPMKYGNGKCIDF